jgi:class 3 adenylate cyclase
MLRAKDTILVKEQSVWGTAETSGFFSLHQAGEPTVTYVGNDFKSARERLDGAEALFRKGRYHYEITIPVELDASQSVFVLKNLLGEYAYSVNTPVSGANTHTAKLSNTPAELDQIAELGFTMEIGGDGKYFTYDSCIITSLELGEIEQGIIPVTLTILARDVAEAGATAEAFSPDDTAQLLDTLQTTVKAGVDAAEVTLPVVVTSLSLTRPNVTPMWVMSDNNVKEWNLGGIFEISGTFEIEVEDSERAAVLDDFNNSDEASIIIESISDQIVTGATPYSLKFDIHECKYVNVEPRTDGHNRFEKYSFRAGIGSGSDAITVTAVNGETTF